jgi:hypothetical protein
MIHSAAQVLVPSEQILSRRDARPELDTSSQAIFCRALKNALTRAVCFNDVLAMINCGGSDQLKAKNVEAYVLGRYRGYLLDRGNIDRLQCGIYHLALACDDVLGALEYSAIGHLHNAELFLGS